MESQDIIVIGYGGWNDGLMAALRGCDSSKHSVYWCDIPSEPPSHIAKFINERAEGTTYVKLGKKGADDLMRAMYEALIPIGFRKDPVQRYKDWHDLI